MKCAHVEFFVSPFIPLIPARGILQLVWVQRGLYCAIRATNDKYESPECLEREPSNHRLPFTCIDIANAVSLSPIAKVCFGLLAPGRRRVGTMGASLHSTSLQWRLAHLEEPSKCLVGKGLNEGFSGCKVAFAVKL